ncbi:flagellar basal body P-ring formation chaperone FlgA [Sulfurimonas sp.]
MYFFKIIFLLFLSLTLYSYELQRNYYIDSTKITLGDIIKESHSNKILFTLDNNRHTKRIKATKLIQILKQSGYKQVTCNYPYIQFNKKSPIDKSKIINAIKTYYTKTYPYIKIEKITVEPNSYLSKLPKEYTIEFRRNAYLSNKNMLDIKTYENKKIFFKYNIKAYVTVLFARKEIKKSQELSRLNVKKKSIILEKFKAMPLVEITRGKYQAKHRIKNATVVTQRDVTGLELVKRGSNVTVTLNEPHINITFLAKALKSAHLGETIHVIQKNGKKIEVLVTGKNRAEVK